MKRTGIKKTGTVFMTALLALTLSMHTVSIALAEEKKPSLNLIAKSSEDIPVEGVEFSLYRVADMPKNGEYTVTEAFKNSDLDIASLDGSSADEMQQAAQELVRFVKEEKIEADSIMVTNTGGFASQEEMERGMYLVNLTGTPGTDLIVEASPFLLSLPMMKKSSGDGGTENISWFDVVVAHPKIVVSAKPEESTPDESQPDESDSEESKPDESTSDESKPDESTSDESQPNESTSDESKPQESTSGSNGGGGGGRDHDRGKSGGGTTTIIDPEVPLASFPTSPDEPELVELEDDPVPLAALPKLGDMGTGKSMAGLMLSLAAAAAVLIVRRKLGGSEEA